MSSDRPPLIALIHGVSTAIEPASIAVRDEFPEARIWNVLDDRLIEEVNQRGGVTPLLLERMVRLIDHVLLEGADGVLITCSLYSFVAAAVSAERPVPILGADSAAFHDVLAVAPRRVLLVASVQAALVDSTARLSEVATEHHAEFELVPIYVEGALEAVDAGDTAAVAELIATAVQSDLRDGDAVLLAQYSLAPASSEVSSILGTTVYSGPSRAARELRAAIERRDRRHHQFYAD